MTEELKPCPFCGCKAKIEMIEILFRAKAIKNERILKPSINKGDWVYGYYCPKPYSSFPCEPSIYPIDTINQCYMAVKIDINTLGRYTGLTDKNGTKIFTGDIVKQSKSIYFGIVKFGEYGIYGDYGFYIDWQNQDVSYEPLREDIIFWLNDGAEVVGNIYDNPKLLEVEEWED